MRHVSRTHRVALDWLFDRINLEPKIQLQYVDTKKKTQFADMLTKGSFSRDEWNHLLRLFNVMNFSMFSCSHLRNFLSDPIGKQSAMSKRGQDETSSEGSPMAKPKPTVPAKARTNQWSGRDPLVSRSPWSARENPPQNLGYPVNPGNVDEGQGDHTATRTRVRTTQNPEVELSQVRRQENAQSSDSWKQYNQEEASYSTSTRKLVQAAAPRTEFQIYEVHEPSLQDKDLPFSAKKLGIAEAYSTFSMATLKTKVLICGMFMASSMKAAIHLGPNYLANLEVYRTRTSRKFRAYSISLRN